MSEHPVSYHIEQSPIGYVPLPQVCAALDFVVAVARSGAPEHADCAGTGCHSPGATAAASRMLQAWLELGSKPTAQQAGDAGSVMSGELDLLTDAFRSVLQAFVADLASHPAPRPGGVFGAYYRDLIELFPQRHHGADAAASPAHLGE